MSDTPETDHLEDQLGSAAKFSHPVIWKHARQLERERDEARESLKHISDYGTEEINAAVDLRQKLAQALFERDEAMEKAERYRLEANSFMLQRDEARNELLKYNEYNDELYRKLKTK